MTCVTTIGVEKLINFLEKDARKKSRTVINPAVNNSGQTIGSMMGGDTWSKQSLLPDQTNMTHQIKTH